MSRTNAPAPGEYFAAAAPGNVIFSGLCKTPSKSIFKKESDRYIVLKMNKDTGAPQVLEWKSTHEPSSTEPPFNTLQMTPGGTQIHQVLHARKCTSDRGASRATGLVMI